ncbi:MAG: Uncharacterized protein G01um10147_749 [Microgenomates group bacterium Gr01-1014_7]|nr:MAG: Uncharacterized protein G01um10147_749 [Microgenomates group bacterium Gr01-1014_7]
MKESIKVIIFIMIIMIILPPAYAADSTPSAEVKTKLEELKKEIASKAAKLKQEVNKKLKDKAYIGKIKTKSPTAITLATKNSPKIVNINQDTMFESQLKSKKSPNLKGLIEEDYLAALGDVDETGVLTAKKIILLPQPKAGQPLAEKTYLWGQVVAVSDKLVTIKDRSLKSIAVSIPNSAKVSTGGFIILTGITGKNDFFEADFVHVIPQGGIIKPKKVASPSAQVSSPSAKPKTTR